MKRNMALVVVGVLAVHAQTCADDSIKTQDAKEGGCGCTVGRDGALGSSGRPVATSAKESSTEFRNKTEDVCATGERFYEGYVKGCIHWYKDDYTGLHDCGMTRLEGGSFRMGTDFLGDARFGKDNLEQRYRDNSIHGANRGDAEFPSRPAEVGPFYIDRCEVTNAQFKEFSDATKYVTDAQLYNWSFVLEPFVPPQLLASDPGTVQAAPWWRAIEGADWEHPEGPGSSLDEIQKWYGQNTEGIPNKPEGNRWSHPVSHVSWRDAYNFCKWRGKRLVKEIEFEFAIRGGLEGKIFAWGDELYPDGKHRMNVWQGDLLEFINTAEDGWRGTAPTASYPPNGHGIYDLSGNIWEWVQDDFAKGARQDVTDRPEAQAKAGTSARVNHKAKRGGSHMCHASTCNRYRTSARSGIESDSSTANLGFRCAKDA